MPEISSGVFAEFASPEALLAAVLELRAEGYTRLEAFSPYPVDGLGEALGMPRSRLRAIMLAGGVVGAALGYGVQWLTAVHSYPLNVGGRPLDSIPAWIPITFESAVLVSCLSGFVAFLWSARLGRLWRPAFEVPGFESASIDGFWVAVDAMDPTFDWSVARELHRLGARRVESRRGP